MRRSITVVLLLAVVIMLVVAAPAFAKTGTKAGGYWPYSANFENSGEGAFYLEIHGVTPAWEFAGPGESPHGGYGATTGKCKVCHAVHGAGITDATGTTLQPSELLLRSTASGACEFCHISAGSFAADPYAPTPRLDGLVTTSQQNYEGNESTVFGNATVPRSGHNKTHGHDNPQVVPAGGSKSYRGCVSCHSVHGAQTMSGPDILKNDPARGTTSQASTGWGLNGAGYGSILAPVANQVEFCEDCHDGTRLVGPMAAGDAATKVTPIVSQADFNKYFPSCGANNVTGAACHNSVQSTITESIAQFGASYNTGHNGRSHIMTTNNTTPAPGGGLIAGSPTAFSGALDSTSATNSCRTCHTGNTDITQGATFPHFSNYNELINGYQYITQSDGPCMNCHYGVGTTF